jgi:hypothetical protein
MLAAFPIGRCRKRKRTLLFGRRITDKRPCPRSWQQRLQPNNTVSSKVPATFCFGL